MNPQTDRILATVLRRLIDPKGDDVYADLMADGLVVDSYVSLTASEHRAVKKAMGVNCKRCQIETNLSTLCPDCTQGERDRIAANARELAKQPQPSNRRHVYGGHRDWIEAGLEHARQREAAIPGQEPEPRQALEGMDIYARYAKVFGDLFFGLGDEEDEDAA